MQNNNEHPFRAFLKVIEGDWEPCPDPESRDDDSNQTAEQAFSRLEIAVAMKVDLETIERVYNKYPEALTAELLRNACRSGSQPGVIGFLAQKLPEAVSSNDFDSLVPLALAMAGGPGPSRHSEEDLLILADIFPEGIHGEYPDSGAHDPLHLAIKWKYSPRLIRELFQRSHSLGVSLCAHYYPSGEDDLMRREIDIDCINSMSSFFNATTQVVFHMFQWRINALVKCLQLIFQEPSIVDLDLDMELVTTSDKRVQDDDKLLVNGKLHPKVWADLKKRVRGCGIEQITLDFLNYNDLHKSLDNPLLPTFIGDLILHMPRLKSLEISWDQSQMAMAIPGIVCLLQQKKTLKTLKIEVSVKSDLDADLKPIFPALAKNVSITSFKYTERLLRGVKSKRSANRLKYHDKHLLAVLKAKNVTLEYAKANESAGAYRRGIHYYTNLNRNGRATARASNTKLVDFVKLLQSDRFEPKYLGKLEVSSVLYGLLRESPSLWCGAQSRAATGHPDGRRCHKRKRTEAASDLQALV